MEHFIKPTVTVFEEHILITYFRYNCPLIYWHLLKNFIGFLKTSNITLEMKVMRYNYRLTLLAAIGEF